MTGTAEEQSKAGIQTVVTAMRIVKPNLAKPGFYLRWEKHDIDWKLAGFGNVGFEIYHAPDEAPLETFSDSDVAALVEIMPRVRHAYFAWRRDGFNRVANALNFFETGYRSNWAPVRFVLFTTALESLFITSDVGVSRQFRERISRFLALDAPDHQHLEDTCRKIYDTRSAIIHGQPYARYRAGIDFLMLKVQEIGRRCLQRVLRDEHLFGTFCGPAAALGRFIEQMN